jgi:hypothetical protein
VLANGSQEGGDEAAEDCVITIANRDRRLPAFEKSRGKLGQAFRDGATEKLQEKKLEEKL